MRAFADSSELIYTKLNKGQKKKGAGHKVKKNDKVRLKRRFRAIQKGNTQKEFQE